VFTGDTNNPTAAISRYLHMTVSKTRKVTGYLLDSIKIKDTFVPVVLGADGAVDLTTPGGVHILGNLAWTGSEDPNGVKQFTGTATIATSNAVLVADREDKYALPTFGLATMSIPGTNNNPGGAGLATLKLNNGGITANYLLGDDDKHGASWAMKGSRSGNVPQWIVTKTGVMFGTLSASDGLTSLTATNLSWIRNTTAAPYPNLLPGGFVNTGITATCSPYDGLGLSGTFTVILSGGGLPDVTNQVITLSGATPPAAAYTSSTGPLVTAAKVDANGKLSVTFLDGLPGKHKTTSVGVVLQNATHGAGFFIRAHSTSSPTNSGSMTLTP
jgi:hypothetical protein